MKTEDGIEFVKCMSLQNANESVDRKIFALAKILFVFFFFPLYFCLALLDLAERQSGIQIACCNKLSFYLHTYNMGFFILKKWYQICFSSA